MRTLSNQFTMANAQPVTLCWLLAITLVAFTHVLQAQVLKMDTSFGTGGFVGTLGTGPGQFIEPSALAFDSAGKIYVSDSENYRVQIFNEDGTFHSVIALLGSKNQTLGVAVNSQGRVYSSALFTTKSEIQMFNPDSTHYGTFGSLGSGNGQLNTPRGLAIDVQDRVFVPDTENHRIQVFDAEGTFLYKFGSLGTGPGQFNRPFRIALDGQGRIYVPEVGNHRVQVLDAATGNHLFFVGGGPGNSLGQFNSPNSVAIAPNGEILVSDGANNRIQIFNQDGTPIAVFGGFGKGPGPAEFDTPNAVAFDPLGRLVVANTFNQRIERYFRAPDTYYPLDTDLSDASGNNLHGTPYRDGIAGNPLVHASGAVNGAGQFDGLNDHAQLPSAALDPTRSFTIATCFQSSKNVDFWQSLVTKAAGPEYNVHDPFLSLAISRSGYAQGRLSFHFSDGDDVHEYETFSDLPVNDGAWHHAAAVYGAGDGKMRLYIDGALNDELDTPGYQGFNTPTDVFLGVATDGANGIAEPGTFPPAGGPAYLEGLMDELRLFGRALDDAEVLALWENGCGANAAPVLTTDNPVVTALEGSIAANSGTFDDPNPGDLVNVTASIGSVSVSGGAASGIWTWSYPVADGTDDSQTVTITADDGNGGTSMITFALEAENVAPTIEEINGPVGPIILGSAASITAEFSDAGIQDTHTCLFSWDDGSLETPGVVSESAGSGSCTASHTYTATGVYTVAVTVTDDDGGAVSAMFEYVVVYDPNGGFVTGGGWINSPIGAYLSDPTLSGKANFGFVSKYQNGAAVPSGQTEFQFRAGDFNFKSTAYDWLVVAGSKAQYKGSGTINGSGDYGFLLSARDGQAPGGGGDDKFRIKITDKTTGNVIYDNVAGAPDDIDTATPQAIGGGSIVVHKP